MANNLSSFNNFNNLQNAQVLDEETVSLKDYINLIKRNIFFIVIFAILGLVIAGIYAKSTRNIYKSTAVLKLNENKGSILSTDFMSDLTGGGSKADRFIENEIEIMKSYSLREKVAASLLDSVNAAPKDTFFIVYEEGKKELGLISSYAIIETLGKKVAIAQKKGLDIIEVSVESASPKEAALIANIYSEEYYRYNLGQNREQMVTIRDFLSEQKKEKYDELLGSEDNIKSYQEVNGAIVLDEQARSLIEQLAEFEAKANSIKIDLTISEKNLSTLKKKISEQEPKMADYLESFATEPYLEGLQTEIAKYEVRKDIALTSSGPEIKGKDALIKDYDKKINDLKTKRDQKIGVFKAGIFASSSDEIKELMKGALEEEVKVQALQASYKEANNIVEDYRSKFNTLPKQTIEIARLERERMEAEKLYLLIEEKYQEALVNERSTPGNVQLIDAARTPRIPFKPNRMLIVLTGLLLGLGGGVGFAFTRSYFDSTVKTPEDIQNLNINVLGWVPEFEKKIDKHGNDTEFVVSYDPECTASESFRTLRTRILFSQFMKGNIQTVLVTSCMPGDGKTTVATNLAGSFAQTGKRTVILDCDLRKPRVNKVFNQERIPGFTDYLIGKANIDDIIRKSDQEELYFIPAGTIPPNPSEILSSKQMIEFIDLLKEQFTLVVLDSPPVFAVSDSEILTKVTDASVLVVSSGATETEVMQKSIELMTTGGGSFIGTVLNRFNYKYGYGSYYKKMYYYSSSSKNKTLGHKVKQLLKG